MSIAGLIQVGAATAQAAIDTAAAEGGDADAAVLRAGVLAFLREHAGRVSAEHETASLLSAYRDWLEIAVRLYTTGNESLVDEYMRRGNALSAEFDRWAARSADVPANASGPEEAA